MPDFFNARIYAEQEIDLTWSKAEFQRFVWFKFIWSKSFWQNCHCIELKKGQNQKGRLWVHETNFCRNFCDPLWELIFGNKWHLGTSEISTPLEIAAGSHFHAWHDSKPTSTFYLLMEKPLDCCFQVCLLIIRCHSAPRKHVFLYPQGDRSSLRKSK